MAKFIDITGQVFGRLTVVEIDQGRNSPGRFFWKCQCICGNIKTVNASNLRGTTRSCGCLFREMLLKRNTKHGLRYTPEWHVWAQMIGRCNNPKNKGYKNYGGRGITIEDHRWLDFKNFIADVGLRPDPKSMLDRLDNEKGYYKDNVAWRYRKEQNRNKRRLHWITFNGETRILIEWSEIIGLPYHTLLARLRNGWSTEKAFAMPLLRQKKSSKY